MKKRVFRKGRDRVWKALFISCLAIAITPLLSVVWTVLKEGFPALNFDFFTKLPASVGETGGGVGHALLGSLIVVGLASLISIPWGLLLGIYRAEYPKTLTQKVLSFVLDLSMSIPSILIGIFAYGVLVTTMKTFSAWAGAFALMIIMVPLIARTTEEMLRQVPTTTREAGLGLGIPRYQVILRIIVPGSMGAIATGILLALSRVLGETAPLLFTAFGMRAWPTSLNQPIATLPVQIYTYSISPYDEWRAQAWSAALLLVIVAIIVNATTRWVLRNK